MSSIANSAEYAAGSAGAPLAPWPRWSQVITM